MELVLPAMHEVSLPNPDQLQELRALHAMAEEQIRDVCEAALAAKLAPSEATVTTTASDPALDLPAAELTLEIETSLAPVAAVVPRDPSSPESFLTEEFVQNVAAVLAPRPPKAAALANRMQVDDAGEEGESVAGYVQERI